VFFYSFVSLQESMDELTQVDFLEGTPPGVRVVVSDLVKLDRLGNPRVSTPDVELHCEICGGPRFFYSAEGGIELDRKGTNDFLEYKCRNCRKSIKTYAVSCVHSDEGGGKWIEFKLGESPAFGPPTPARTISLVGPDREQFLQGRRCENQGLGVGAFVYYRRVVESQKNRIFDEIIRVSKRLDSPPELGADLEAAKTEVQFTKAVDAIKHALPQSLWVNGHNPLILLHSALSAGVHELSDGECLELARSVRVVLIEFSERLAQAMKDEAELNEAVKRLAGRNSSQSAQKHQPAG